MSIGSQFIVWDHASATTTILFWQASLENGLSLKSSAKRCRSSGRTRGIRRSPRGVRFACRHFRNAVRQELRAPSASGRDFSTVEL